MVFNANRKNPHMEEFDIEQSKAISRKLEKEEEHKRYAQKKLEEGSIFIIDEKVTIKSSSSKEMGVTKT